MDNDSVLFNLFSFLTLSFTINDIVIMLLHDGEL